MKKFKILTVLGILLAMGITACNKGGDNGGAQQGGDAASVSEQQGGGSDSTPAHTHKWGSWSVVPGQEPTCTEAGKEQRACKECDAVETRDKAALGHDWDNATPVEGTDTSTCTADGVQRVKCGRAGCNETKEVPAKAHHKFGAETEVAKTGTDDIAYKTAFCSVDSALKISFPTEVGGVYSGTTRKNGTPEGYTKLTGSGSISWKLNLAGAKGYIGKMYHMACMDAFSSNSEKNYGYYTTSGSSTRADGNFKFYVNGIEADKSAYMNISFGDLTKDGENDPALDAITSSPGPYSPVALCPLGDNVYIGPGENVFKYERTGSYNMVMRELVFIGTEYTHEHNNSTDTWAKDENQHWNPCTNPGCPTNGKVNAANHTFQEVAPADDTETDAAHKARAATCSQEGIRVEVCSVCQYRKESPIAKTAHTFPTDGGWTQNSAPTCTEPGERQHECTECHEIVKEAIPALGHDFSGGVAQAYPAGEGYIASSAYNCASCGKAALRWSARDFDATLSSTNLDLTHDSDKSVRFASGEVENKDGAASTGSHIIYKINVAVAVEKAGLSFKIKNTAGSGWGANAVAPVFGLISGDSSLGAIDNGDGTYTTATHRYGLKVNGVEYFLGDDNYGNKASVTDWFNWPVEFPLTAGINTIDVFAYAGYRADMYEFQVTGLPHVEPAHTHVLSDWQSDDNNHWKICTAEGCLDPEGTKYENAAHTWGDVVVKTAATHSATGVGEKECTVCHKKVEVTIPKVAHEWVEGTPVANTDSKNVIPLTCACGKVGAKINVNDYSSMEGSDTTPDAIRPSQGKPIVYKIIVSKAGNYSLEFGMFCKSNDTVKMSERGFSVKVNDVAATVTIDGNTTPKALGMTSTNAVQLELCASIPLVEGENTIAITCAGYRLHYKGNLVVAEL